MLRVLLAMAVLLGHTGGFGGYMLTGGPVAVQAFYIISGFYMGLVLNERYDRPALNCTFYLNRAIRIYAIYLFFLALYLAVMAAVQIQTGSSPLAPYLTDTVSLPEKLFMGLLNLTVAGQDLTLHLGVQGGHLAWTSHPFKLDGNDVFHFMLIPMAWSLALEIYFYALAPFIARRPARQIALLMSASIVARIVAALMGYSGDPYSYRFFPFELAFFLAGVLAYKAWAARPELWQRPAARLLALAVPVVLAAYPWLRGDWPDAAFFSPARIGTLLLVAVALPAIHGWSRHSRLDRTVGELSYPVYLSHFLVTAIIPAAGVFAGRSGLRTLAVIAVTLALSWVVVRFLDDGIEAWRRRIARRAGATGEGDESKGGDSTPRFA
ncbi:acyltransferase [Novosphingobium sp. G106]|uniref:acyltransferase family protein n=1 Tax=Novosphingobium sp. G106 TaxID=2849500 RepID=UPI001C2D5C2D|nr:acyltransferase [Novosphingobium sp. G106]MBV1691721.1 acyltransferase [Novosphingobium sp. G106]